MVIIKGKVRKMKKNIVKKNSHQTVTLPDVIDMDTLSYASDEELLRRVSYLANDRDRAIRNGYTAEAWETEICYVQRELSLRQARRISHEKYVSSMSEDVRGYFDQDVSSMN